MRKMLILLLAMLCLMPAVLTEEYAEPIAPVLMLKGNPTTGYDWGWTVDREGIVEIASEYTVNWEPAFEGDLMPAGVGGCSKMTLTGMAAGDATITFAYRRAWEEKEPLYTLVYHVRVDGDLNVTILGSGFDW